LKEEVKEVKVKLTLKNQLVKEHLFGFSLDSASFSLELLVDLVFLNTRRTSATQGEHFLVDVLLFVVV